MQLERDPTELLFPPGSMARIIGQHLGVVAVAAGRAILMQLAHPGIAAGIDEHSTFRADPLGRTMRTTEAFRRFFWRSWRDVEEIVPKIRAQHARVRGDGYFAEDPELLLWVHATTIDSLMIVYSECVRPLDNSARATYMEEATVIAELLGCPRHRQPDDLPAFDAYIADTVATLRASDVGRSLTRDLLYLPTRTWAVPLVASYRLLMCGFTPDRIRRELDIPWTIRHRTAWRALGAARVPLRVWRRRREAPDPATMRRDGTCRTCRGFANLGPHGLCGTCARRGADARMAQLERFGKLIVAKRAD
jgi:uncharacterized protein (DUF2236 family)